MKKAFFAALLTAVGMFVVTEAQQAPPNINVNSSVPDPNNPEGAQYVADPFRQRTVEPAIAVSPLNAEHIVVSSIDYRVVDQFADPGVGTGEGTQLARLSNLLFKSPVAQVKEAWIGLYFSYDRGQHWINMLHPAHPFDTSLLGTGLPIFGRSAGSDPVLAAAPGSAHFYLGGMYFDRGGFNQVAVTRLTDRNDDSKHPIVIDYDRFRVIDSGSATSTGNFGDKGFIAADAARGSAQFGRVFFSYTVFTGKGDVNKFQSQVRLSVSGDGGNTWSRPNKINGTLTRNQGSYIAINPANGVAYIFWRTFDPSRIVWVATLDGKIVSPPQQVTSSSICAYDAFTQSPPLDLARTLAFPAAVFDNQNKVHVVWQGRELVGGQCTNQGMPRIFMTTGTVSPFTGNISSWTTPTAVDVMDRWETVVPGEGPVEVPAGTGQQRPAGPQFKPAISHSGGHLLIFFKESRLDNEQTTPDLDTNGFPSGIERRVDVRAVRMKVSSTPFTIIDRRQIARYDIDSTNGDLVKANPDSPAGTEAVHHENLRMYQGGNAAFGGDYEAIVPATQFVPGSPWHWATNAEVPSPSFFSVWYDTRTVIYPFGSIFGDWTKFTNPGTNPDGGCNPGSRNSAIYFAESDSGVVVSTPQTFKRMGTDPDTGIPIGQVTYAVKVLNRTEEKRQFKLTLQEAAGVDASWFQFQDVNILGDGTVNADGTCPAGTVPKTCTERLVILPRSSATLTVFATGPDPSPSNAIKVIVEDQTPGLSPLPTAILRLNAAPQEFIPSATTDETHTPGIGTPTVFNGSTAGGPAGAPGIGTPGIGTPGIGTPGIGTPGIGTPGIGTPGIGTGSMSDDGTAEYTDVVFTVSNDENDAADINTSSGFNSYVELANESEITQKHLLQLIILQTGSTPTVDGCNATEVPYDQVISFIPGNPGIGTPGIGTPGIGTPGIGTPGIGTSNISNATFTLAPSTAVGGSHQSGGTPHSLRQVDRKRVVIRAWHCHKTGGCDLDGDGNADLQFDDPATESFPENDAEAAAQIRLAVAAQANDKTGGMVSTTPTIVTSGPDLLISSPATLTATPSTVVAGDTVQLSAYTVTNQGQQSTGVGFSNGYYLSQDAFFDGADTLLGSDSSGPLAGGASASFSAPTVTIPPGTPAGTRNLLIVVDHTDAVTEFAGNNVKSVQITVVPGLAVPNTDFVVAGLGGLRGGSGSGSISVSGVSGTITKALLYWHGPTNSSDAAANASINFKGTPITGTNIGFAGDNNWAMANSQAYRADVTSLVSVGQTDYPVSNLRKLSGGSVVADINGVSLLVFFDDGTSSNNRTVYLYHGNDSNGASTFEGGGATGWSRMMSGINYVSGVATLQLHVGDGQKGKDDPEANPTGRQWIDGALSLNGTEFASQGHIFSGDSVQGSQTNPAVQSTGGLWDIKSFTITSFLSSGTNTLTLTSPHVAMDSNGGLGDFLSLVVAVVSLPTASGDLANASPSQTPIAIGAWKGDVSQFFELTVDLANQRTSLSIGRPVEVEQFDGTSDVRLTGLLFRRR